MTQSRTKNTARNSFVGMVSYIITSLITFATRTVFIKVLGEEYLGVSGLYSNILAMLALSDLGINTAMVYSLYKPLSENDTLKISALIRYFKKLYYFVAIAVAVIGVACIPLLPYITKKSALSSSELVVYYLLILANSICSYFAISKSTLIRADQKMSTVQVITSISTIAMNACQIAILLLFENFTVYLVIPILFTIINNLLLSLIANKKYPYLKQFDNTDVSKEIRENIIHNLKSTFIYKLGASVINSTDNILISVLLGTVVVGFYSNYFLIVSLINAIISILIQAVIASVGNYNATQTSEKKYELFCFLLFIFYAIAGFCAACYLSIFSDFVNIWIGKKYVLDSLFLVSLVFSNFIACISNPIWMTRESSGLFKPVRYVMLCAAIINIILSIVLGKIIGLAGIIFATGISRLLTLYWYEPKVLCNCVFNIPYKQYWIKVIKLTIACVPIIACGWLLQYLHTDNIFFMLMKVILCGVVCLGVFFLFFKNSNELFRLKDTVESLLKRKQQKGDL